LVVFCRSALVGPKASVGWRLENVNQNPLAGRFFLAGEIKTSSAAFVENRVDLMEATQKPYSTVFR